MQGKEERGSIFSSAFGILLRRRKKFPEVAPHKNFGVPPNEPCYFHQCRRADIRRTGRAAAAVVGSSAPPCVKRRVVVSVWRLQTHEGRTVLEHSKRNPAEIKVADSKSCTGSFFSGNLKVLGSNPGSEFPCLSNWRLNPVLSPSEGGIGSSPPKMLYHHRRKTRSHNVTGSQVPPPLFPDQMQQSQNDLIPKHHLHLLIQKPEDG